MTLVTPDSPPGNYSLVLQHRRGQFAVWQTGRPDHAVLVDAPEGGYMVRLQARLGGDYVNKFSVEFVSKCGQEGGGQRLSYVNAASFRTEKNILTLRRKNSEPTSRIYFGLPVF